jgi:hypothetical protein
MSTRKDWWTPERRAVASARTRALKPSRFSTGPRTPEGKARVRLNALKHGLRSKNPSVLILGTLATWEESAKRGYQELSAIEKEALKAKCPQLLAIGERLTNEQST